MLANSCFHMKNFHTPQPCFRVPSSPRKGEDPVRQGSTVNENYSKHSHVKCEFVNSKSWRKVCHQQFTNLSLLTISLLSCDGRLRVYYLQWGASGWKDGQCTAKFLVQLGIAMTSVTRTFATKFSLSWGEAECPLGPICSLDCLNLLLPN